MQKQTSGLNGMMPPKRAAVYLGICVRWVQYLAKKKGKEKIPHYLVGRRMYFKQEDLDRWLEQRRQAN